MKKHFTGLRPSTRQAASRTLTFAVMVSSKSRLSIDGFVLFFVPLRASPSGLSSASVSTTGCFSVHLAAGSEDGSITAAAVSVSPRPETVLLYYYPQTKREDIL